VPAVEHSVSWHDAMQRNRLLCHENAVLLVVQVMVRCCGCYANGLRFDSRLATFCFFSLLFFQAPLRLMLPSGVSVGRLGLG